MATLCTGQSDSVIERAMLRPQEIEYLRLRGAGKNDREIEVILCIANVTLRGWRTRIKHCIAAATGQAVSNADLGAFAREHGLVATSGGGG